jgi:hypothetical protein
VYQQSCPPFTECLVSYRKFLLLEWVLGIQIRRQEFGDMFCGHMTNEWKGCGSQLFLNLAYPLNLCRYPLFFFWFLVVIIIVLFLSLIEKPNVHCRYCVDNHIVFSKWETKHLGWLLSLASINKFSDIGTLIPTWLTMYFFSTGVCQPVMIQLVLLVSHHPLELPLKFSLHECRIS